MRIPHGDASRAFVVCLGYKHKCCAKVADKNGEITRGLLRAMPSGGSTPFQVVLADVRPPRGAVPAKRAQE
jgi:hypothetical protein